MQIKQLHRYPFPADQLVAAYQDEAFTQKKLEAIGARNVIVTKTKNDDGHIVMTIDREMPADVPGMLKSVVSPWNRLIQTELWSDGSDGPVTSHISVDTDGVPVSIKGVWTFQPTETGCDVRTVTDIKSAIPLVGGRLEKFVADATAAALRSEFGYVRQTLSEQT